MAAAASGRNWNCLYAVVTDRFASSLCLSRFLVPGSGAASWSIGRYGSLRRIRSDFWLSVSLMVSEESSRRPRGVPVGVTGVPTGVPADRATGSAPVFARGWAFMGLGWAGIVRNEWGLDGPGLEF